MERYGRSAAFARALPAVAVAGLALAQGWRERGSIAGADWLGYAVLAGLVLAAVAASGAASRPTRLTTAAATALAALAGWDAISLAWSARPDLGRDEAFLAALYAIALVVPALALRGGLDRELSAAAVTLGTGALALAAAVEVERAHAIADVYYSRRLDFPVSYPNAEAAFALVALWPGIALAARRRLPVPVRALALAAACAGSAAWAMSQSKGGAVGIAVSTVAVFALSRDRLRLVVPFAIVAVLTGAAFAPLTEPYRARDLASVHQAGVVAAALTAAAAAAGIVYALADRRIELGARGTRLAGRVAALALVVAVVGGVAAFAVRVKDPGDFFAAQWRSFKHLPSKDTASTHFVSLGSNRYDFWRVALHEFTAHPVGGIGARGFREAYLLHRRSPETPARAHSVELDALSETGIVGFALLAAALACAGVAVARRARLDLVAAGALGAFLCWLAQASVDWTWSFPAIGVPVLVLVGIGAGGGGPALRQRVGVPLAVAAAALAIGGFGVPWLASRYVRAALDDPAHAQADLRRARSLDSLSVEPLLAAWALAPTPQAGIPPLVTAARRLPRSPDMLFALGRQQLLAGERRAGRRTLERALRLDPGDPTILAALHSRSGH